MTDTQDFPDTLHQFYVTASEICNEILDFQPDLVVALMHSGWLPLFAGMELWKRTQRFPFPPVAKINLGREKTERFDALDDRPGVTGWFIGEYDFEEAQAFFLSWLYEQTHWQKELQEIVQETMGGVPPRRILIVDEFIHEGTTYFLTLGLLSILYPQAETRFYNAGIEIKDDFLVEWIKRYHRQLLSSSLFPNADCNLVYDSNGRAAKQMVLGTEDIDPESLYWKRIEIPSVRLDTLKVYLPAADWLKLPIFVEQLILGEIESHAKEFIPQPGKTKTFYPQLRPGPLILREIYRHGPLTAREVSQYLSWTIGTARYQLNCQVDKRTLVEKYDGTVARYHISPRLSADNRKQHPIIETYWVLPGRLLAGEFPSFDTDGENERLTPRLEWLLDAGVTCFLDLSYVYPNRPESYDTVLKSLVVERKQDIRYLALPTLMRGLPSIKQVQYIVNELTRILESGHVVYIHDYHADVTETILGCFLVQQGFSGVDAIKELERLRQGLQDDWRRAPVKTSARRLVRGWAKYVGFRSPESLKSNNEAIDP